MTDEITLADRIRGALTENLSSGAISAIISDAEAEAERLKASAAAAEQAQLDPLASADDIAAARATAADAEFQQKRLAVAQERLAGKLAEAQAAEQAERDAAAYDAALKERDALAADLSKIYPKAAQQIADLLARIAASDAAVKEANQARGGREPILPAEHVVRGGFRAGVHRLGEVVNLPKLAVTEWQTPYWGPRW